MIAVSGCLLGEKCRYDGGSCPDADIIKMAAGAKHMILCPEMAGGLQSPRPPAEISGGNGFDVLDGRARVIDKSGRDVTQEFLVGARVVLDLCLKNGVEAVYFKDKSPSCGTARIYDGTFQGVLKGGPGVCAALLIRNGVEVKPV